MNYITSQTIVTYEENTYAIPVRKLDMGKVAAAQAHANSIREELASVVVLDMSKVAQAQADAHWIMSKFGK